MYSAKVGPLIVASYRIPPLQGEQQADAVIVMIHGGREYDRAATEKITYLTEIATRAGATLVVNHHPHVVSGLEQRHQALIAWSMGNFFYDQTVWPSLESYMLAVYLQEGKVIRAYVEPLMIDGFVPHGVAGELADFVVRGAAGQKPGPFIMESGSMEVDFERQAVQHSYTESLDSGSKPGQILVIPPAQWISHFNGSGKLLLGRDLLWVGGFENNVIDSPFQGAPLWDLNPGRVPFGREYAYEGKLGIHLTRNGNDTSDSVTTNKSRVIVQPASHLSIAGMIRMNRGATVLAQFSWYSATSGPSFLKTNEQIEVQSYDSWQPFRFDIQVPPKAIAPLYLRLILPGPEEGQTIADFDNIRIIEWAHPSARFSPLYDFAQLTGSGNITFTQEFLPGAEAWRTISAFEQNK
jgi:poly-gamma-glutamate synthesis protein (capsule biosynthesis protein)